MDWTNQKVMKFLELYQMHPCIWDPKDSGHKNKNKINAAWIDIEKDMGCECTVTELKKKKDSLMAAFRAYKTKIKKSETSESGSSEVYRPVWFAYDFMNSFLGAVYKCSINTESPNHQQDAENSNHGQNNTGNTGDDTDVSNREEASPSLELQVSSMTQSSSSSQQMSTATHSKPSSTTTIPKRRQHYPPEPQLAKNQTEQVLFDILKSVAQPQRNDEEDECSIFGKLVAKKLRTLTEDRRDLMMIKINQLFYDERQEHNMPNSSLGSYGYLPQSRYGPEDQFEERLNGDNDSEKCMHSEVDPTALYIEPK
ncbi:unnamed protein product [Callosobruchus maculatus]|uniref:MADF domain-containing protein n=1 Tax=Callosobruchus maculatus TaxID=64391 RepID=A0A653BR17_CALMS|nr:unnamed protein product [Callosobruchus maculatus]